MTKHKQSGGNKSATVPKTSQTPKVCRLCETKDGPFLNIFDTDMDLSKKIDALLPITVMEYDDLPHKVCFRCSAKLSDLDEFVNKCIVSQENLFNALNKPAPKLKSEGITKSKKLWSTRLSKNKISNNTYCEELIQKALESVGKNVCDSVKNGEASLLSKTIDITTDKIELRDCKRAKQKDNEDIRQSNPKENSCIGDKKQNDFSKLSEDKNQNTVTNVDEDKKLSYFTSVSLDKKPNNNTEIPDNTKLIESKSKIINLLNETKKQTDVNVKKAIISLENENDEFEEKHTPINDKNKGEDPNFEKDIRVCISRVSKDPGKEAQYEVKQDTVIQKKNVSTFKVAGVGTVYSCEDCSRIFLNKDKMPGHKCITDKLKLIKEAELYDAKQSNNDLKVNINKDAGKGKDLKKEEQKSDPVIAKLLSSSGKKVPGPASKTLNKITEKNTSPSFESLTIDSIMKNLISNQMHYQLVPGPNNTLTLQATPQTINIPISVLQQQSMHLTPSSISVAPTLVAPTSVAPTSIAPTSKSSPTKPIPQSGTGNIVDSSTQGDVKNKTVNQSNAKSTGSVARGRNKNQLSQPNIVNNDKQSKTRNSLQNEVLSNTKTKEVPNLQKPQISRVKNLENQFSAVPLKPCSSTGGPFPVAFAKNLFITDNSSEVHSVIDDLPKATKENKRKSRDLLDRSKKAKVNPEIIELDDDAEPPLEMDLLEERPKAKRGRGRPRINEIPITKVTRATPAASQTYRVVPNNNPRKLIISTVGSAPSHKESSTSKKSEGKKQSSGRSTSKVSEQNENCSFFTHFDDENIESIIPDKTVVQESQITTTVSARASKSRGSTVRESVGSQKCMMCNMSFSDNAKLSAHMKIHYANWI